MQRDLLNDLRDCSALIAFGREFHSLAAQRKQTKKERKTDRQTERRIDGPDCQKKIKKERVKDSKPERQTEGFGFESFSGKKQNKTVSVKM